MLIPWETGLSRSYYQYWISEGRGVEGGSISSVPGLVLFTSFNVQGTFDSLFIEKYKLKKLFSLVNGS